MKKELFVVAGAIFKDNKVFCAKRGNKGETAFKWEFPGGKIEPNESPQEALKRELFEELNINVKVKELISSVIDERENVILHIDTFVCALISGKPTLSEHLAMDWANKDNLVQHDFSDADEPTLKIILEKYLK